MASLDRITSTKLKQTTGQAKPEDQEKSSPLPDSNSGWEDLFNDALNSKTYDKLASSIGDDNGKRFEIATMLAEQDLDKGISNLRRNDYNLWNLTDKYFNELGGDAQAFNTDRYRGTDNWMSHFTAGLNNISDNIFGGIGDAIDFVGDNTLGNLVGLVDQDAGQKFKDAFTGDDLKWIPSAAVDIGTWLLPGAAIPKLAFLTGKGLMENADSFGQAISGRDSRTGEDLTGSQRFVNALAGLGGTALTALPGASVAKGVEKGVAKKAAAEAEKKVPLLDEAINGLKKDFGAMDSAFPTKEAMNSGVAVESPTGLKKIPKGASKEEKAQIKAENKEIKETHKGNVERAKGLMEESGGLTPQELIANIEADRARKEVAREAAENALADNKAIIESIGSSFLPERGLVGSFSELPGAARSSFSSALEGLRPKNVMEGFKKRADTKAANTARREELKKTRADLRKLGDKEITTASGETRNAKELLKEVDEELAGLGKLSKLKATPGKLGEAATDGTFLKGQAMMTLNDMLQNSAELGADSENVFEDWGKLMETDAMYPVAASRMLGMIPGFRNKQLRARGFSPMGMYSARADLTKQAIKDAYNGSGVAPTDYDLAILAEMLRSGDVDSSVRNIDSYYQEQAAKSKAASSSKKEES